ncbi:MAG: SRPBCC family protein [Actinomycetes bacterium]
MAELVVSVEVDATPERTWRALVDWESQGDWMLGTRVRGTERGGHAVGGGLVAVTGVGPLAVHDSMVVTQWEPPQRCVVRHTGRAIQGAGAFEVEPLPGGRSRVVWSEWVVPPLGLLGQAGWLLVRPLVRAGVAYSLRRLAGTLAQPPSDASPIGAG